METKELLIGGIILLVIIIAFPVVYANWPRDPNPALDAPHITQFDQAIRQYRKDFGMLPQRLDQLSPKYMSEIPLASNREPFVYDPNTGKVKPPYPMTTEKVEAFKDMGVPVGAGGPMGEVMTGIGIRNELNY